MGASLVLGELILLLWSEKRSYSITIILLVIVTEVILYKKDSSNSKRRKSTHLLSFLGVFNLCMIIGAIWCFASYGIQLDNRFSKNENNRKEYLNSEAYIEKVEAAGEKLRIILKTSDERFIMYVDDEDSIGLSISEIETGRYIWVRGKRDNLLGATNPGALDMEDYYFTKGIHQQIRPDNCKLITEKKRYIPLLLFRLRKKLKYNLDKWFEEDESALLSTMLLGDKSGLSDDTKLLFQRSGIAHILAISGLHIMLLASILEILFRQIKIRKQISVMIVLGILILYGLMTGFSEATTRAVLMLGISKIAFLFGRTSDMPTSMMEALILMTLINPPTLFSTGCWMTFSAVIGVTMGNTFFVLTFGRRGFDDLPLLFGGRIGIWLKGKCGKWLKGSARAFVNGLYISICINIWMLPLIIKNYYEIPILALILNLIVIPLLTILVICGLIVAVLGDIRILYPGIRIAVFICKNIVLFYKLLCGIFIRIPCAVISTGHVEIWQLIIIYSVLIIISIEMYLILSGKKELLTRFQIWIGKKLKKSGKRLRAKLFTGLLPESDMDKNDLPRAMLYSSINNTKIINENNSKKRILILAFLFLWVSCTFSIITICGVRTYNIFRTEVVFLDVGQGDGSIIHISPGISGSQGLDGENYIVDSGSTSITDVGKYALIPALRYYAMTDIDCIFISHTDLDHVSGIIYLLENGQKYGIQIRHIAFAAGTEHDENYDRIVSFMKAYKSNYLTKEAGEESRIIELKQGDIINKKWEVIYPGTKEINNDTDNIIEHHGNDYSLVVKLLLEDTEILYTGDIGNDAEMRMVEEGLSVNGYSDNITSDNMNSDDKYSNSNYDKYSPGEYSKDESLDINSSKEKIKILKCPHHGSKYSCSNELLEAYDPDITVISVGRYNNYGHPSDQTINRLNEKGIRILRTDQDGAVILTW